ncbi:hypothetical protein U1Q18_007677 [Sarracenia purpurea var. burkii]
MFQYFREHEGHRLRRGFGEPEGGVLRFRHRQERLDLRRGVTERAQEPRRRVFDRRVQEDDQRRRYQWRWRD